MESYEVDVKKWHCSHCLKIIITGTRSYHYKDYIYCSNNCLLGKKINNQNEILSYNKSINNNRNKFYKIKSSSSLLSDLKISEKLIEKKKSSKNSLNKIKLNNSFLSNKSNESKRSSSSDDSNNSKKIKIKR